MDDEEFVKRWQKAESADDLGARTRTDRVKLYQRAHYLRTKGVPLKNLNAGARAHSAEYYAQLAKLARETK